jgi:hypothetical protein
MENYHHIMKNEEVSSYNEKVSSFNGKVSSYNEEVSSYKVFVHIRQLWRSIHT